MASASRRSPKLRGGLSLGFAWRLSWSDPQTRLGVPQLALTGSRPLLAISGTWWGPARLSPSEAWTARI